jgi:hypothetical protein
MGLDPSRLVTCASGWTDHPVGHVADAHVYPGPSNGGTGNYYQFSKWILLCATFASGGLPERNFIQFRTKMVFRLEFLGQF